MPFLVNYWDDYASDSFAHVGKTRERQIKKYRKL